MNLSSIPTNDFHIIISIKDAMIYLSYSQLTSTRISQLVHFSEDPCARLGHGSKTVLLCLLLDYSLTVSRVLAVTMVTAYLAVLMSAT